MGSGELRHLWIWSLFPLAFSLPWLLPFPLSLLPLTRGSGVSSSGKRRNTGAFHGHERIVTYFKHIKVEERRNCTNQTSPVECVCARVCMFVVCVCACSVCLQCMYTFVAYVYLFVVCVFAVCVYICSMCVYVVCVCVQAVQALCP